jgi:hypothetical protein
MVKVLRLVIAAPLSYCLRLDRGKHQGFLDGDLLELQRWSSLNAALTYGSGILPLVHGKPRHSGSRQP